MPRFHIERDEKVNAQEGQKERYRSMCRWTGEISREVFVFKTRLGILRILWVQILEVPRVLAPLCFACRSETKAWSTAFSNHLNKLRISSEVGFVKDSVHY